MSHLSYPSVIRFVFPLFLLQAFWFTYATKRALYWRLVMPEHLQPGIQYLEWFQFCAYLTASCLGALCLIIAHTRLSALEKIYLAVFSLGTLFLSLEEVSYGQRVFNFKVPSMVTKINLQDELNIHNTVYVQPIVHKSYILLGFIGGLGWIVRSQVQRYTRMRFSVPDWSLITYFLPVAIYYTWVEVIQAPRSWQHQEMFEFVLSIGVVLFAIDIYQQLNHSRKRYHEKGN